jgi:hypothetical protein
LLAMVKVRLMTRLLAVAAHDSIRLGDSCFHTVIK